MPTLRTLACLAAILVFTGLISAQALTPKEQLGKHIFFDTNLSQPAGQSCATCHAPEAGFTGSSSSINATTVVYPGAVSTRFGNRKPPTSAYGGDSPVLFHEQNGQQVLFVGGMFWDGRATGWELGDPLAEQARGPFLNPVEQNISSREDFLQIVRQSSYASLFEEVYGTSIWDNTSDAYTKAALAVAAYERSAEVNPFSSKFDHFLKGSAALTKEEQRGYNLFKGKGKCAKCHVVRTGEHGEPPLFTDFTYDNLGLPKNPDNPFYTMPQEFNPAGSAWIDPGLGAFLQNTEYADYAAANLGKHKVPTLRNVDKRPYNGFVKAYGHNGYFKSLKDIVHFYNTRDVESWPPPEVSATVNTSELGNLHLSSSEEDAIVAFLKTLSDGYVVNSSGNAFAKEPEAEAHPVLHQNAPNPFNPTTLISYELPVSGNVSLRVYNTLGMEVATLVNEYQDAGARSVSFHAGDLSSGIYFYRLQGASFVETKKFLLMK